MIITRVSWSQRHPIKVSSQRSRGMLSCSSSLLGCWLSLWSRLSTRGRRLSSWCWHYFVRELAREQVRSWRFSDHRSRHLNLLEVLPINLDLLAGFLDYGSALIATWEIGEPELRSHILWLIRDVECGASRVHLYSIESLEQPLLSRTRR